MDRIKRIKLFVNETDKAKEVASILTLKLCENGFEITDDFFDLGIAVGGDGTFLRMVKQSNFDKEVFYVGINAGTLGFAQEIGVEEIDSFIDCLKTGKFFYEEIGIQEVEVQTEEGRDTFSSINEIVVREEELNAINLDIYVDEKLLENYVGDGILIATSFGSTAYNRSFGGSIVYNKFHTLQITPIAPLNNKKYQSLPNSVILPSDKEITLLPTQCNNFIITVE